MIDKKFIDAIALLEARGGGVKRPEFALDNVDVAGRLLKLAVPDGVKTEDSAGCSVKSLGCNGDALR